MRLRSLFLSIVLPAVVASTGAQAQSQTQEAPPVYYTVDQNGVDLITGQLHTVTNEVVIGQPGAGGLSYGRVALSRGWRDLAIGGMDCTGPVCLVSFGGTSEVFTVSGGVYTPLSNRGATLAAATGGFVFTSSDGVVAELATVTGTNPYTANTALVTEITEPNGLITTYHYTTVGTLTRLQSVTNNRGYQIHYRYDGVTPSAVEKVMGLNMAVAYCDPVAPNCNGVTGDWPSVTYARTTDGTSGWYEYATDQSSRTTRYHFDPNFQLDAVLLPGEAAEQIAVLRNANDDVTVANGANGRWTYDYSMPGTIVADGPSGEQITVVANAVAGGQPQSIARLLQGGETPVSVARLFQYDSQQRLRFITEPEGNQTEYQYDARGNVERVIRRSKDLSSTVVTSAQYPTTCITPVTCNKPFWTVDPLGNQTDYSWDPDHGGLLAITEPAPETGADRPQTRFSYAEFNAYYKRTSSTVTMDPEEVWLPTIVSACVSGTVVSGCNGTAAEILTVASYDTTGNATNLLPYRVWTGAADLSLGAAQDITYTDNGDVATVTGPLPGQKTAYFYDDARQLTGVVEPDPNGSTPPRNRAQRIHYSDLGLPDHVEVGTVAGFVDPISGFTRRQQQVTQYGPFGRPLVTRQQNAAGATFAISQVSYDDSGRPDCAATRMNLDVTSLPTSACTATALGPYGPDRIARTTYDLVSRPLTTTTGYGTPNAATESVTYTDNGQIGSLTDARNNTSAFEYDGFDRLARLRYPDPSNGEPSTTDDDIYGYDLNSNPVTFTNRAGQVFTTTFDDLNRATDIVASGSTAPPNPTLPPAIERTYDLLGRTLTASVAGGVSTTMTWDALGRQRTETGPTGTMNYEYDIPQRRARHTWPDGFAVDYFSNAAGEVDRIERVGSPNTRIAEYAYDDLGRRAEITRPNGIRTTYAYDGVSRLMGLSHLGSTNVALTFGYNPAGQITTRTTSNTAYAYAAPSGTTTYTLDRLNRVSSANGVGFTYDTDSNLTGDAARTYGYDAANRLVSGGSPAGTLSYDALGRLDVLTGAYGGRFVYNGVEAVALANSSTNAIENHFIRGPGVDEIVANYPTATLANPLFWMLDERNSLLALTDIGGGTPYTNGYDEYGNPRPGNLGRFQYTGQLLMPDFGAYHYKARAYSPGLGRFLQADPLRYGAGTNLFAYVSGDPMNLVDPFGLDQVDGAPDPSPGCVSTHLRNVETGRYVTGSWSQICPTGFPTTVSLGFGGDYSGNGQVGGVSGGSVDTVDDIVVTMGPPPPGCPLPGRSDAFRWSQRLGNFSSLMGRVRNVSTGLAILTAPFPVVSGVFVTTALVSGGLGLATGALAWGMEAGSTGDYGNAAINGLGNLAGLAAPGAGTLVGTLGSAAGDELINFASGNQCATSNP